MPNRWRTGHERYDSEDTPDTPRLILRVPHRFKTGHRARRQRGALAQQATQRQVEIVVGRRKTHDPVDLRGHTEVGRLGANLYGVGTDKAHCQGS